jgi:hypothetical protein
MKGLGKHLPKGINKFASSFQSAIVAMLLHVLFLK